jgi:hypothetical protein
MAGIKGSVSQAFFFQTEQSMHLSSDLNERSAYSISPTVADVKQLGISAKLSNFRVAESFRYALSGSAIQSFFDDYYNRIHVNPASIDLQTIVSPQTRQIEVWNAHVDHVSSLVAINLSELEGVEITGPSVPLSMNPLAEMTWDVAVGTSGPPTVDVEIQFDFASVIDPFPVIITGNRAVRFDILPEVPVVETWEWFSDLMVAVDGTEQRVAVRGEMPRVKLDLNIKFDNEKSIREFYATLIAAVGRLWVPEFQYATQTTAVSAAGTNAIYFDNTRTDIRDLEYILLQTPTTALIVQVSALTGSGVTLNGNLQIEVPIGSIVIPGSSSLLEDGPTLDRYSANGAAESKISATLIRQRSTLERQGSSMTLPTYDGFPLLSKRPLADSIVGSSVSTGQQWIDNQTGALDLVSRWDYSRIGGNRSYKVDRIFNPADMDFWKAFLSYTRGRVAKFFTPTFRNDLELYETPGSSATSYTIKGNEYVEKLWALPTHKNIEIETASGIHRAKITSVANGVDYCTINFTPAVPAGVGYTDVKRISFLLPVRLNDDSVEWEHFGLHSTLNLSLRTAE